MLLLSGQFFRHLDTPYKSWIDCHFKETCPHFHGAPVIWNEIIFTDCSPVSVRLAGMSKTIMVDTTLMLRLI
jgi:hypothetical protein